jgi:hypothetical protein
MWVPRDFKRINPDYSAAESVNKTFFGEQGATVKLGRASMLRTQSARQYAAAKKADGIVGPYLPLIIEACREDQFSYEYRDGATSHGAFTYSLSRILREQKTITFRNLVKQVAEQLKDLQYDQTPDILGPSSVVDSNVPWK